MFTFRRIGLSGVERRVPVRYDSSRSSGSSLSVSAPKGMKFLPYTSDLVICTFLAVFDGGETTKYCIKLQSYGRKRVVFCHRSVLRCVNDVLRIQANEMAHFTGRLANIFHLSIVSL